MIAILAWTGIPGSGRSEAGVQKRDSRGPAAGAPAAARRLLPQAASAGFARGRVGRAGRAQPWRAISQTPTQISTIPLQPLADRDSPSQKRAISALMMYPTDSIG